MVNIKLGGEDCVLQWTWGLCQW